MILFVYVYYGVEVEAYFQPHSGHMTNILNWSIFNNLSDSLV